MEDIHDKEPRSTNKRRMRAKLIFNPGSGVAGESPVQLMDRKMILPWRAK